MKKIKKILISTSALVALAVVPAAVVACSSATSQVIKPNAQGYYTIDNYQVKLDKSNNTAELISYGGTFPNNWNIPAQLKLENIIYTVTKIGNNFSSNSNGIYDSASKKPFLKSIPNTITYIGTNAFSNINNMGIYYGKDGFIIPKSVKYIGKNAFGSTANGGFGTTIIENPNVKLEASIENTFSSENVIWKKNIDSGIIYINANDVIQYTKYIYSNNLYYSINKDNALSLVGFLPNQENSTSINIPASINIDGTIYSSFEIPENLFISNTNLTTLNIEGDLNIGESAFQGCSNLVNLNLGKTKIIGSGAFWNCSIQKLVIPASVTSIGSSAFQNNSSLSSLIFEKDSNLKTIESFAFYQDPNISSIDIPDSVTTIGNAAFISSDFNEISLPTNLTWVITGCPIWSIDIPRGIYPVSFNYQSIIKWKGQTYKWVWLANSPSQNPNDPNAIGGFTPVIAN